MLSTVVLEKILESALDGKEIKPVSPKGSQPWIFTGRTNVETEAPILSHMTWRADSLEKTLMLGKTKGKRRRGWQRMRRLDSITNSKDMNLSKLWETVKDREDRCAAVHEVVKSGTEPSDWTTKSTQADGTEVRKQPRDSDNIEHHSLNQLGLVDEFLAESLLYLSTYSKYLF